MAATDKSDALETRAKILRAACEIAKAGNGNRVSVRAVATRAGVGLGTLRYHFPTQRGLLDAVLSSIYEEAMPDERIRDSTVPPHERLVECLHRLLAPVGLDGQAREVWSGLFHAFIDPATSTDSRAAYLDMERQALGRVESWLSILVQEGSLAPGDNAARARFLMTVLNGLAVQRALPSETTRLANELDVLHTAIDSFTGTQ